MNQNKKKYITNNLLTLSQNISDPNVKGERRTEIITSDGITFVLIDDFVDQFYDLIKKILNESNWNTKFSEKYIHKSLQTIIAKIIKSENKEDATVKLFSNFVENLTAYNTNWLCIIPLSGIELHLDEYKIGKVRFVNATIKNIYGWFKSIENVLLKSKHTELEKYNMKV